MYSIRIYLRELAYIRRGAPNIVPIGIDNRQIEWSVYDGAAKYLEFVLRLNN